MEENKRELALKTTLYFIIIGHWLVIIGNLLAFFLLPFLSPWYIALPIMSYIGLLTFSRVLDCPMTKLENTIRQQMNLPEIKGFIGHYMLKPLKRAQVKKRIARRHKRDGYDSYGMYR